MSRTRGLSLDPRLSRGNVVERLNVLRREGTITEYQLSPRECGGVDVAWIAIQVPPQEDAGASLAIVRDALHAIPLFADFGGEIEIATKAA